MRISQRMQKYQTNVVQGLNLICPDSCSIKIRYEQLRKHESQLRKDRKTDKYEYIYIFMLFLICPHPVMVENERVLGSATKI